MPNRAETVVRQIPLEHTRRLRQAVLRPHQTVEEMATDEPEGAFAAGAFVEGRLLAVGLIGRDGADGAWRVRGMATEEGARGRALGSGVLQALLRHAASEGATRVWCNARVRAIGLYERFGFEIVSEEFEVPKLGPHFVMEQRAATGPRPRRNGEPSLRTAQRVSSRSRRVDS